VSGLRAWVVSCCVNGDTRSEVVFAETRDRAKANGPECDFCGFIDRSVRRAPEFDERPPSQRDLVVDHGWHHDCNGPKCWKVVHGYDFTEGPAVSDDRGDVYCSAACAPGGAP
jgi:hypothetical protein